MGHQLYSCLHPFSIFLGRDLVWLRAKSGFLGNLHIQFSTSRLNNHALFPLLKWDCDVNAQWGLTSVHKKCIMISVVIIKIIFFYFWNNFKNTQEQLKCSLSLESGKMQCSLTRKPRSITSVFWCPLWSLSFWFIIPLLNGENNSGTGTALLFWLVCV